eukprot:4585952-Lingulodinium_polyedra.AAC.1
MVGGRATARPPTGSRRADRHRAAEPCLQRDYLALRLAALPWSRRARPTRVGRWIGPVRSLPRFWSRAGTHT